MKRKQLLALLMAVAMTFGVTACGQPKESATSEAVSKSETAETSASSTVEESVASSEDTTQADEQAASQSTVNWSAGSPWINCAVVGNLADEQPSEKDDFYQAVNYQWISENQDVPSFNMRMLSASGNVTEKILAYMDENSNSTDMNRNMSILFSQAKDVETLAAQGMEPLQKYMDMIDSAKNIEELNALLGSEEYPFESMVTTTVSICADEGKNVVGISPHLFAVDDLDGAEVYRNIPEDFKTEEGQAFLNLTPEGLVSFMEGGFMEKGIYYYVELLQFEASYGKVAPYNSETSLADYGKISEFFTFATLEELKEHCGNFPIEAILAKEGRNTSEVYNVEDIEWLDSLASVYTDENLDYIKAILKLLMLKETRNYTIYAYASAADPTFMQTGVVDTANLDSETINAKAIDALSDEKTYGQEVGRIYKDELMTRVDYERLYNLGMDIIQQYKETISANEWLSDGSRNSILKKLDAITFNILGPSSGYLDCSGVEMKSTEEGGTLIENYIQLKKHMTQQENTKLNIEKTNDIVFYYLSPTVQNAMYDPESNSFNILPGIITEMSYNSDMSDEELFARIGSIMAHEISHGFDYSGSQYDAVGRRESILTTEDQEKYLEIQQKVMDYYSSMVVFEGGNCNGRTVVTEAVADLAGLQMLEKIAATNASFDYDKFYKSFAELYSSVMSDAVALNFLATDTHPANYLRVNINSQMLDSVYDTYGVEEGDGMYLAKEDRITVW